MKSHEHGTTWPRSTRQQRSGSHLVLRCQVDAFLSRFPSHHHHHQPRVCEDRSVVLAPWPRRTALLHRSAGKQLESPAGEDLAICSVGDQEDVSNFCWKDDREMH